jgi:hypothetical protein
MRKSYYMRSRWPELLKNGALVFCLAVVPGLLYATTSLAGTTTINFNALTQSGSGANCVGHSDDSGGFTFADASNVDGVCVWQTGSQSYTGETMLFEDTAFGTLLMTPDSGIPFVIQSIDLATVYDNSGPSPVTFLGQLNGGGTVTVSTTLDSPGITTFVFPSDFTNLDSLSWLQTPNYNQFTDLVVGVTPEPSSYVLFGTGLLAMIGLVWRRKGLAQPPPIAANSPS